MQNMCILVYEIMGKLSESRACIWNYYRLIRYASVVLFSSLQVLIGKRYVTNDAVDHNQVHMLYIYDFWMAIVIYFYSGQQP